MNLSQVLVASPVSKDRGTSITEVKDIISKFVLITVRLLVLTGTGVLHFFSLIKIFNIWLQNMGIRVANFKNHAYGLASNRF